MKNQSELLNKFYFTHDMNTPNNSKIRYLLSDHGYAGYGLFWFIVERLHEADGQILPLDDITYFGYAGIDYSGQDVEHFIHDCIEKYKLFKNTDDGKFFYSDRVKENIKKREEISEARSEAAKKRWGDEKQAKNNQDLDEIDPEQFSDEDINANA